MPGWSCRRGREGFNLGKAGVGAAREAVGARSISTSSTSKLSSLLPTGRYGVELGIGVRLVDSARERFASGDSGVGLDLTEPHSGLLPLALPDLPKPNAFLNPDATLGVSGVVGGVVRVDDDEDGRAAAGCLTEAVGDVLAALRRRADVLLGDVFFLGDNILVFLSGVILIAEVRLTFKADDL